VSACGKFTRLRRIAVALFCEGLFELLERSKIILRFTNRVMQIDIVSSGPETQHPAYLPFRQALATSPTEDLTLSFLGRREGD
jgi:hypothetical protein